MMKLAIIGRPNVGKSSLFNRICKKRISIVAAEEGVTRDRLYGEVEVLGKTLMLIDTGGIDPHSKLGFQTQIRRQAEIALREADVILFVVDGKIGPTLLDEEISKIVHLCKKPVFLVVNKIDNDNEEEKIHNFFSLGFQKIIGVSASHGSNVMDLLQEVLKTFSSNQKEDISENLLKIAILGRTNVGKSTLLNYLLQEDRAIVSNKAGTTRDWIDVVIEKKGRKYLFIDTAGIRRKKKEKNVVEKFASIRAWESMERADICLLILDARYGLTTEEKRVATRILKKGKGLIFLFNRWDEITGYRMEHCLKDLREKFPILRDYPHLFISAKTGRNVSQIFEQLKIVETQRTRRISTGELNQFIKRCLKKLQPPMIKGKRLKIYYMTQVESAPPKFVCFVNKTAFMSESYRKYLVGVLRNTYGFQGTPFIFQLRDKS